MTSEALTTSTAIADWLRVRVRSGEGLAAPYARRWEVRGCTPTHTLWDWPSDRLATLGADLLSLGYPVYGIEDAVTVAVPGVPVVVAVEAAPGTALPTLISCTPNLITRRIT
jgi:hypothetical protein